MLQVEQAENFSMAVSALSPTTPFVASIAGLASPTGSTAPLLSNKASAPKPSKAGGKKFPNIFPPFKKPSFWGKARQGR
jgi:hypothetical protein